MSKDSQSPLTIKGNVPIIGQQPIPYHIGGHTLGFTAPPADVKALHAQALQQGWQPDVGFVLAWQCTAMHLAMHAAELEALKSRCAWLEEQVAKLAGVEPPTGTEVFTGGNPAVAEVHDGD